jgi:hypothetical protein
MGKGNDMEALGHTGTKVNLLSTNFEGTNSLFLRTLHKLTNCDSKFI